MLPDLLAEPSPEQSRWLQGGPDWWPSAPRGGYSEEEELAEYVIALLPREEGGSPCEDDPVKRRQAFASHLAAYALLTTGQPGTPLKRARQQHAALVREGRAQERWPA